MLCSVIEYGMTPFRFQTAQKNSASLRSSVWQFENSMTSYHALQLNNARLPMFELFDIICPYFKSLNFLRTAVLEHSLSNDI